MVNPQQIETIADYVAANGVSEGTIAALRANYEGCHFTYCMDDDISAARAYLARPGFNIYLVDSRQHCSVLTTDDANASGVVIAEVIE